MNTEAGSRTFQAYSWFQLADRAARFPNELATELLQERHPSALLTLEHLLADHLITERIVLDQLIYNWAEIDSPYKQTPLPPAYKAPHVSLQWEGLRDGDQHGLSGVKRLSSQFDLIKPVFAKFPSYGITMADLGMPISGPIEQQKIISMIKFIHEHHIPIVPAVAGRTHPDDVTAIKEVGHYVNSHFGEKITVYAFVGSSRIRMLAQGQDKWNLANISKWIENTVVELKTDPSIQEVIIPFEDTFGAFPDDIDHLFRTAFNVGADRICICDTCSRAYSPEWTRHLLRFIGHTIAPDYPNKLWEIHTHNMLGDAVTNAITATQEGLVSVVHGTFGGVGDLGGNMPIESFLLHALHQKIPLNSSFDLTGLGQTLTHILSSRGISSTLNPFSGTIHSEAARMIPTGTHADAFKRLGEVGPHMRKIIEHVYFPISPTKLGLDIRLDVVTPVSGKANVRALAERLGIADKLTTDHITAILSKARNTGEPLSDEQFLEAFSSVL